MDTKTAGRKFGALSSSEDPQKLAASVTGAIIATASIIVLVLGHLGFPLTVVQVTTYAGAIGTAVGSIWATFGLVRKFVIWLEATYRARKEANTAQ